MRERLTRTKVVEAAADLADQSGLDELTITKLGHFLGIAPPGIYRHVADLDDLRREISKLASFQMAGELSTSCVGLSGKSALEALANTMRSWAAEHPGRYAALQIAPDLDDVDGQAASESLLKVIISGLRAYSLEGDDLTDAIRIVRSALHGFISLELNNGFKQPRDLDSTFHKLVASLDEILRA